MGTRSPNKAPAASRIGTFASLCSTVPTGLAAGGPPAGGLTRWSGGVASIWSPVSDAPHLRHGPRCAGADPGGACPQAPQRGDAGLQRPGRPAREACTGDAHPWAGRRAGTRPEPGQVWLPVPGPTPTGARTNEKAGQDQRWSCPALVPGGLPRPLRASAGVGSLEGDGGAGALEGSLGLVRNVLGNLLQNHLRSAVNHVLGLLQAEAREGAHLLDDLDLLLAHGLQDDVELVLLLDLGDGSRAAAGSSNGNRGRSGDIEGVLEEFHELGELDKGHCLERLDELVSAELCHGGSAYLVDRAYAVSGVGGGSSSRDPDASAPVATRGD